MTTPTTPARATSSWRVVDIVLASVLGVVSGLVLFLWNVSYGPLDAALSFYPPLGGLLTAAWVFPGVLGGLIIRKPGAALYVELVAAVLSALIGNAWGGPLTVLYGLGQGLGAEAAFAAVRYRRWSLPVVVASGAGAGLACGLLNLVYSYAELTTSLQLQAVALCVVSGAVIAAGVSWLLAAGLRATGALSPLASGRDAVRV